MIDPTLWDCRWPDPVALQVASERILQELPSDHSEVNPRLSVVVQMEPLPTHHEDAPPRALLVTPWAVERVYWNPPGHTEAPPIHSAYPLACDEFGQVEKNQGALLEVEEGKRLPVMISWEPETGHTFNQTLIENVHPFLSSEEALRAAIHTADPKKPSQSVSNHLKKTVDRRAFFSLFRRQR
ncbi:hypothetical protein ACQZV8_04390 [Magnetococcales bacterium HHB-1]